jgi:hypothetical protein
MARVAGVRAYRQSPLTSITPETSDVNLPFNVTFHAERGPVRVPAVILSVMSRLLHRRHL